MNEIEEVRAEATGGTMNEIDELRETLHYWLTNPGRARVAEITLKLLDVLEAAKQVTHHKRTWDLCGCVVCRSIAAVEKLIKGEATP